MFNFAYISNLLHEPIFIIDVLVIIILGIITSEKIY